MGRLTVFLVLFFLYAGYSIWVYTEGTCNVSATMSEHSVNGKMLFQKYNCTACHQLYGLGGYLGPELTTLISENGKGAVYAAAFIKSGSKRMPNFKLNDKEIDDIVEYLTYVDHTALTYHKRNLQ